MLQAAKNYYLPEVTLLFRDANATEDSLLDSMNGKDILDGQATAYICDDTRCRPPITDIGQLKLVLDELVAN
jgi:uncharacterized protein YyaL (SSP411 family)